MRKVRESMYDTLQKLYPDVLHVRYKNELLKFYEEIFDQIRATKHADYLWDFMGTQNPALEVFSFSNEHRTTIFSRPLKIIHGIAYEIKQCNGDTIERRPKFFYEALRELQLTIEKDFGLATEPVDFINYTFQHQLRQLLGGFIKVLDVEFKDLPLYMKPFDQNTDEDSDKFIADFANYMLREGKCSAKKN